MGKLDWNSIKTLPKLDNHNHDELGITEKGFLVHYVDKNTGLLYVVDEYELFNDNDNKNAKIVGISPDKKGEECKLFTEEELAAIQGMTEYDLPKIRAVAGLETFAAAPSE
jgi:hypothetical protein